MDNPIQELFDLLLRYNEYYKYVHADPVQKMFHFRLSPEFYFRLNKYLQRVNGCWTNYGDETLCGLRWVVDNEIMVGVIIAYNRSSKYGIEKT